MTNHTAQQLQEIQQYWDVAAATFDQEADHGLREPGVRRAWHKLLAEWLPTAPARVLDIGCGTGSLSLLLAEQGYRVTGIDLSPRMIEQAERKATAAGQMITWHVMEASNPRFAQHHFDLLLCRHLLWALPEPEQVLARWSRLLRPHGRLILIEGFWHTGGLHLHQVVEALPPTRTTCVTQDLSAQAALWGGPVQDERYLVTATF
ncbi:MAG: class I SAM-dependent methyltransferase [Caldilineaceae bacterium]